MDLVFVSAIVALTVAALGLVKGCAMLEDKK
jgi:hypothetical protein